MIEQAVEAARPLADAAGHQLAPGAAAWMPIHLSADAVRLGQVFGNLLNNSCKYTDPGGTITVRVARERRRGRGDGRRHRRRHSARSRCDSIFDMFTQVEQSRERAQGGLGIGLTLVRRLVQMHGGSVEARSAGAGQGSQFVVRLPIVHERAPAAAAPAVIPRRRRATAHPGGRRQSRCGGLARHAARVGRASHRHGARRRGRARGRGRPTGPRWCCSTSACRCSTATRCAAGSGSSRGARGMVLLALTGWGQEEDRDRTRAAGFDGHLVKPVDYTELMTLLGSLSVGR